jgi:hypothetical protein
MLIPGYDIVGGVQVNPSCAGNINGQPGMGGVYPYQLGFTRRGLGVEIAADITGRKPQGSQAGNADMGKILANAAFDLKGLC